MRVKYARKNVNGLGFSRPMLRETNYLYDSQGPDEDKDYGGKSPDLTLGFESNVYAISVRRDCTSYYIKEPTENRITHFPSVCFDVVDNRISKYWCLRSNLTPPRDGNFPQDAFESKVFAIREWIEEPSFLRFLVDDRERELGIMNEMVELMDAEFPPPYSGSDHGV